MRSRKLKLVEPPLHPDVRREVEAVLHKRWEKSKPIRIFAVISILAVVSWIVVALFSPVLKYQLAHAPSAAISSEEFVRELQALTDGRFGKDTSVEPLPNGENFYSAELEAIRTARQSINTAEPLVLQKKLPRAAEEMIKLGGKFYPPLERLGEKKEAVKGPGLFKRAQKVLAE